jgi:hypothetical protein
MTHERRLLLARIKKERREQQQRQKRENDLRVIEANENKDGGGDFSDVSVHKQKKHKSSPQPQTQFVLDPNRPEEEFPTYYKTRGEALRDTVNGGPFLYLDDPDNKENEDSLKQMLETRNWKSIENKTVLLGVSANEWRVGKVVYITARPLKGGVNIIADMTVMYYHTATNDMFYEDFVKHTFKRKTWLAVLCPKTGA